MDNWSCDLSDADVLACARSEHPAFRLGADLAAIDPAVLSRAERVDLLVALEEQRRWFEAWFEPGYSTAARPATKARTQVSMSLSECTAESCTRIRALPCGTTG